MITLRRSAERGSADHGWLKTFHSFSFADYYDPQQMGFKHLRVINEDFIAPGQGFGKHSHRDMEIVTYVVSGVLEHKDSLGNVAQIVPGELQRMSAGSGIQHSEYNGSKTDSCHLLQIWLLPSKLGVQPGYEQERLRPFSEQAVQLMASPHGDAVLTIQQNARIYVGKLTKGKEHTISFDEQAAFWLQLIEGEIDLGGTLAKQGDGAYADQVKQVALKANSDAHFLLFEMF